jgi:hypothetical protein
VKSVRSTGTCSKPTGTAHPDGNDWVNAADLACVLGTWDASSSQREIDFTLAQWNAASGRDLLGDVNGD